MSIAGTAPSITITDPVEVALAVFADRERWEPRLRFDDEERWYTRLVAGAGYEAWLLTWLPGQGTGLHDHGGSAGAFVVASGTLGENTVERSGRSGRPAYREETREFAVGQVRAFGPRHIHEVFNTGTEPAVSIHVYAPALRVMSRYELAGGELVRRSTERAGADW